MALLSVRSVSFLLVLPVVACTIVLADPGDDTCNVATPLPLPAALPMNVFPPGDHNWVVFDVPGPESLTVRIETLTDMPGTGTDNTDLKLWRDCAGGIPQDEIAFNDDSPLANDLFMSRIDTYCLNPGLYWVEVGGSNDTQTADNIVLEIDVSDVCKPQEPGCGEHALATAPCDGRCSGGGPHCGARVSGGRSVYLFSGEFYEEAVDMRIRGRGPDFVWGRKYRSRIGPPAEGIGNGWDHSYDIRIFALEVQPGEAQDLRFVDKQTLVWNPPANPGGPPGGLLYCTQRSPQADDFLGAGVMIDPDDGDLQTIDIVEPASGEAAFYLVSAKNGFRESSLGRDSSGLERQGQSCGVRGPDLLLDDGNTRRDRYQLQPDGVWTGPEFFRTFEDQLDGSHTLHFPDTGQFTFHPFDLSPRQGRITRLADANGNALVFAYDDDGQLTTVTDTLDRDITIARDANGFIETVTDFTGRSVRYDYYEDGDSGGSAGDLKSVTTPIVTGTPTGNDFPDGKTTTYTYSTGFADERLNHNLLTITDPKGQTYLVNEYAGTLDDQSFEFDRVIRQTWGDPGDVIDFVYLPVLPDPANGDPSVSRTIVNDREGNVTEYLFDAGNRGVIRRDFTGRADPDLPTTPTTNPPVSKLRVGDPNFFETRWEYDEDSQPLRISLPNDNVVQTVFDPFNPDRRSQGNVTEQCRLPGPLGGDQPLLCETFEYDTTFNFITEHTDARGHDTVHVYDASGNRTKTTHRIPSIVEDFEYNGFGQLTAHELPDNGGGRRRDEFTYYAAGPQRGYLETQIVDAGGFDLVTTYEYDQRGNVTSITDPRGSDTQLELNALDQVVRELSRELPVAGGTRYEKLTFYDANDNVVRIDVENVDEQGASPANSHFTTVYEYEILDRRTLVCTEAGSYTGAIPGTIGLPICTGLPGSEFVLEEYEYDDNRNQTLQRKGESVDGSQPTNTVTTLYDERDLVFQTIRAQGDADQSTTQFDYDGNANVVHESQGLEGIARVTTHTYDGYDRLLSTTDPLGNRTTSHYDPNGNRDSLEIEGELIDVVGDAGNVRLFETEYTYDFMDRRTLTIVEFFDTVTQAGIDDGESTTAIDYSDNSQILAVTDDNGNTITTTYDSANRVATVTDAKDNLASYAYDANSNVTVRDETDRSDLGGLDQGFSTSYAYDALDRLIRVTDNEGNLIETAYDSRHNDVLTTDALGLETRYVYDGMSRMIRVIRDLDGDGADGDGIDIVTTQTHDDSSRLTEIADGKGNRTTTTYDALDRVIATSGEDATTHTYTYDVHGNRLTRNDANGTSITQVYDLNDRLVSRTIVPGAGVVGTTGETYAYDGLSRPVTVQDDDSTVTRSYDSLSRVTSEVQNGQTITSVYDGVGNKLDCTYPGGRVITATHDLLDRIATVADGAGAIASYDYVGPGRVERRDYDGNGTRTEYTYDGITGVPNPAGDDGVKRIIGMTHSVIGSGVIIDERTYLWDGMYNKKQRKDERATGPQILEEYTYDPIYRLEQSVETPPGPSGGTVTYTYDETGNRTQVVGGPDPGIYTQNNTTPNPADEQMNQYTTTPLGLRTYDENGNYVGDGGILSLKFDYRNQLVEYVDAASMVTAVYEYDGLGRRIERVTSGAGVPSPGTTRYFYDGWRVVEEQDGIGSTQATYVYGNLLDELLTMQRGGADFYYHADEQSNVMALTDSAGTVVERYDYRDFGQPTDVVGTPLASSSFGNPWYFGGHHYDFDTRIIYLRQRWYDPAIGRFLSRDAVHDHANLGNLRAYTGNNPATWVDPYGRATMDANPPPPHPGPGQGGRLTPEDVERYKAANGGKEWGIPPPPPEPAPLPGFDIEIFPLPLPAPAPGGSCADLTDKILDEACEELGGPPATGVKEFEKMVEDLINDAIAPDPAPSVDPEIDRILQNLLDFQVGNFAPRFVRIVPGPSESTVPGLRVEFHRCFECEPAPSPPLRWWDDQSPVDFLQWSDGSQRWPEPPCGLKCGNDPIPIELVELELKSTVPITVVTEEKKASGGGFWVKEGDGSKSWHPPGSHGRIPK